MPTPIGNRILSEVSAYARVPLEVIHSKTRKHEIVSLRALASKVMMRKGYSMKSISKFWGHADHTTVMLYRDNSYLYDDAVEMILERL